MNNKRICSPLTRLTGLEFANAVRREQIRLLNTNKDMESV